nr:G protein-coupled receptor [Proales similis]
MLENSTVSNQSYAEISQSGLNTPDCLHLQIIGIFCIILFLSSTFFNVALLRAFINYKELQTSLNAFIIALTSFNLIGTVFELPFIIISNLRCRWAFSHFFCVASAYLMYFVGCTSIYLMAAIALQRFYIIYKPMEIRSVNFRNTMIVIAGCCLNGLFWSTMPLIGWSHYSIEGAGTSCSVEWNERSLNVTSYNTSIFMFVFLIPLGAILYSSLRLMLIVKQLPQMIKTTNNAQAKKRLSNERKLTVIILFFIAVFIVAWTPYALVALYTAFIDADGVPPLLGTIPAIFAKSSMLWSTLFYILLNKNIFHKVFCIPNKQGNNARSSTTIGPTAPDQNL